MSSQFLHPKLSSSVVPKLDIRTIDPCIYSLKMLGCPWFKPLTAWSCIVISVFGIVILGTLALLFNAKHEELVGSGKNPPASQGPAIAQTIGIAVMIYTGLIVCCYGNILLANRQARRGQIALS